MPVPTLPGAIAGVLAAVAFLAGSGCTPAGRSAQPPAAPARVPGSVRIVDTAFLAAEVTVTAGSEVRWSQVGGEPHSVTDVGGSFDSSPSCSPLSPASCLHDGSRFTHTFSRPGTYRYYCRVHGTPGGIGMVGTVVVRPST